MINNILASFGMWLTRRFGSVRPGGVPTAQSNPARELFGGPDFTGDQIASALLVHLKKKHERFFYVEQHPEGAWILESVLSYLANRNRTCSWKSVSDWWLRDSIEALLVGRDTPHEADQSKEAKS